MSNPLRYHPLLLVLFCCLLYLPGLGTLPPTDRDEARYAQASRQMVESGNYLDIRFQEKPRYKKPIGIYWLQALVAGSLPARGAGAILPYRIPSVAGALLAVLATFGFGRVAFSPRTAFLGAALLAVSLLLTVEAHLAKTDAFMLLTIVVMQGALGRIYLKLRGTETPSRGLLLVFWLACGAGILIKGPVSPMVALLTIGTLALTDRSTALLRGLRSWWGVPVMLAVALPWFVAIQLQTQGAFLGQVIRSDLLPKLVGGHESHGAPPGMYLLLFPALFWPGSILALASAWPSWQARGEPAVRFCLAWIVPTWLVFELIPTKLPHYVLPVMPAVALLCARFILERPEVADYLKHPWWRRAGWLAAGFWVLICLVLSGAMVGLPWLLGGKFPPLALVACCAGLLLPIVVIKRLRAGDWKTAAAACLIAGALVLGPALGSILPGLKSPWLSRLAAAAVARHAAGPVPQVAAVGFHEPSLVFYLGTRTLLTNAGGAAAWLADSPTGMALVSDRDAAAFLAAAAAAGIQPVLLESLRGFNYSKGRWITLDLYTGRSLAGGGGQ